MVGQEVDCLFCSSCTVDASGMCKILLDCVIHPGTSHMQDTQTRKRIDFKIIGITQTTKCEKEKKNTWIPTHDDTHSCT